ncbi:hypothetical protein [Arthrobacter sp. Leaf137]|uniref:hypothetical protein n=1 Tax=Arthrobacter sp. Leaf137 TaxID=1736271 RepID=UPI0006F20682|nr:hypothetical protein [Arthrobacter sp. Leaf137]KQQ90790.1 hypothetical protein ASF64_02265 [Arthrobacter sp. Leaf137]
MEHERFSDDTKPPAHAKSRDEQVNIRFSAWASSVVALLVMGPSVYRLATGAFAWWDLAFIAVGIALITFHMARLRRLRDEQGRTQ